MDIYALVNGASEVGPIGARMPRPDGLGPHHLMIVQIVIVAAALVILWWMLRSHYKKSSFNKSDTPLDILNKRYAAGELTKEEYERLKKDIGA